MKNKLLATIVVLLLSLSMILSAVNISTAEPGPPPYSWLTIVTNPLGIYTWPTPPSGNQTTGTWVNVTAPQIEFKSGNRYRFLSFTGDDGSAGPYSAWVHMTTNRTLTVNYQTQHYWNVVSAYGLPLIKDMPGWWDNGTTMWGGLTNNVELIDAYHKAVFVKWTGASTSTDYTNTGVIALTSNKTCTALWDLFYWLYVLPTTAPDLTPPDGWYIKNSVQNVTSPNYVAVTATSRQRFDYWSVDGSGHFTDNPHSVTMNTNHTATAHFVQQWLIENYTWPLGLAKVIGGGWFDNCTYHDLTAPDWIAVGPGVRYKFHEWHIYPGPVHSTTMPLHLHADAWHQVYAVYDLQYNLTVNVNPSSVPGFLYSDSDTAGFKLAGSTINMKAKPIIAINSTARWKFDKWTTSWGWFPVGNNITFPMGSPATVTANYYREYKVEWTDSPIHKPGWANFHWTKEGDYEQYDAYASYGTFVFWNWTINGVTYNTMSVPIGPCNRPLSGTAYYANTTAIIISGGSDVIRYAPGAYCTYFDVNVTLANFNSKRLDPITNEPMDIYGMEFKVTWDSNLIECTGVTLYLDNIWGAGNWYIAKNNVTTPGEWFFVASAIKNVTGFENTKVLAKMRFHIIYEPCYPTIKTTTITMPYYVFVNHVWGGGYYHRIFAERFISCVYRIEARKPVLKILDATDKDSTVVIRKNYPVQEFFVEIWVFNVTKMCSYDIWLTYPLGNIMPVDVQISNFLPGPFVTKGWEFTGAPAVHVNVREMYPEGPCISAGKQGGLLFTVKFRVINQIYWKALGPSQLDGAISFTSCMFDVCCPYPTYQYCPNEITCVNLDYYYIPLIGDLNFDGLVNSGDLLIIARNFHPINGYDLTGDGVTDIFDLVLVALNFDHHV